MSIAVRLLLIGGAMPLLSLEATGSPKGFVDCAGCHLPQGRAPQDRFASGLGKWDDTQCVGCHAEINAISKTLATSEPGKLNFHLPLSLETQRRIATHPLSLNSAPPFSSLKQTKFDPAGLAWFVQRPPGVRSSMPSFPKWKTVAVTRPSDAKTEKGRILFDSKGCATCHGDNGMAPHFSGFVRFTADHIFEVASGLSPAKGRTMPVIPMSLQEAGTVRSWVSAEKKRREQEIDRQVDSLRLSTFRASTLTPAESSSRDIAAYLFGPFPREGTCVHCHGTMPNAKKHFDGTGEALRRYVKAGGAFELWKRLETRHLERKLGVTAASPGMPMNGSPLARPFLEKLAQWIEQGCPDEQGTAICQNAKQKPHKH
jgi:mono/diheme cytochrome c family protein